MGMEGPGGGGQEVDPLAHLLEESGLENTAENRAEAEQVKAAFAEAREKDADITPEKKEAIESEISERQFRIIDGGARFAKKKAALESDIVTASPNVRAEKQEAARVALDRANRRASLYEKLMYVSGVEAFAAGTVGIMGSIAAATEGMQVTGLPELTAVTFALLLGTGAFAALQQKWENRKLEVE